MKVHVATGKQRVWVNVWDWIIYRSICTNTIAITVLTAAYTIPASGSAPVCELSGSNPLFLVVVWYYYCRSWIVRVFLPGILQWGLPQVGFLIPICFLGSTPLKAFICLSLFTWIPKVNPRPGTGKEKVYLTELCIKPLVWHYLLLKVWGADLYISGWQWGIWGDILIWFPEYLCHCLSPSKIILLEAGNIRSISETTLQLLVFRALNGLISMDVFALWLIYHP